MRSWVMKASCRSPSPGLAERADLDIERPCATVLMRDVPDLLGDRCRFDEERVRPVGPPLARPGEVDHRINQHVGDMDAFGPELAPDRLGEDALRGFRRGKAGEVRLAAERRRIPAGDDRTSSGGYHGWGETAGEV